MESETMTWSDDTQRREALLGVRRRLMMIVSTLAAFGLVFVYSASTVRAGGYGWELAYLVRQAQWLALGIVGCAVALWIPPSLLRRFAWLAGAVALALLAAVRVPGVGTAVNGAYRWFRFGGISVQPSEIAKFAMVLALAALLARQRKDGLPFFRGFLPAAGLIGLTAGLIAIEPDFGTAALIGAVLTAMLIVGGARLWQVLLLVACAVPPAAFYGLTRFDHIVDRVQAWLAGSRDGAGYQIWMSKIALGSGGVTGRGLGEGPAKLYYLPEAHTDFIFAIAGQELGLVGTLAIVSLFGLFVHEGMRLVRLAPDRFSALLAFGIVAMIGLQAAFNIAVVTASVPPKGISLPFISFGGSGLCMALTAVGILGSIAKPRTHARVVAQSGEGTNASIPVDEAVYAEAA